MTRLRIVATGVVQGVGFRPHVARLAREHGLVGSVRNTPQGVEIRVAGEQIHRFIEELRGSVPPIVVDALSVAEDSDGALEEGFAIEESLEEGNPVAVPAADLTVCAACAAETLDPTNRRYRYAFTSCAQCGPRHTIAREPPFDRAATSMAPFSLCSACRAEYDDPANRRNHAQTISCPACGPRLFFDGEGDPIDAARALLVSGGILALQGVGGFQLLVDATNEAAVQRLRERKGRPDKPLAVLVESLAVVEENFVVSPEERGWLGGGAGAIVLCSPRSPGVCAAVTRGIVRLGVMLPTTPLHLLLARGLPPLVCTSGNAHRAPMCTDIDQARHELGGIADAFLWHDRAIVRRVDDSVVRITTRGPIVLRRGRGLAPRTVSLPDPGGPTVLAMGAHLKGCVGLAHGGRAYLSSTLGKLSDLRALEDLDRAVDELLAIARPEMIAVDSHPDYASTRRGEALAERLGVPLVRVEHHHAHACAVAGEHGVDTDFVALCWDGVGLGPDGRLWGGEILRVGRGGYERIGGLRPFRLLGGDAAAREPLRSALSVCWHAEVKPPLEGHPMFRRMWESGLQSPEISSMGRLFDAVAALVELPERTTYEAQAAMLLEDLAASVGHEAPYPLPDGDWRSLVRAVVADRERGVDPAAIARRFHEALASWAAVVCRRDVPTVLAGGCFQNALLTELCCSAIEAAGGTPLVARVLSPNDEAIAYGQLVVGGVSR